MIRLASQAQFFQNNSVQGCLSYNTSNTTYAVQSSDKVVSFWEIKQNLLNKNSGVSMRLVFDMKAN